MLEREMLLQEVVGTECLMLERAQCCGCCCQDDWGTFEVSRVSQMEAWPIELLRAYQRDQRTAREEGRNLLCERYARMLARTQPERYAALETQLPPVSMERRWLAEWISAVMIRWRMETASRYPALVSRGRAIRSEEDRPGAASYETYLLGELLTCSVETLRAYAAYIERLTRAGENLCLNALKNAVRHYGYDSPETAEADSRERVWQKAL